MPVEEARLPAAERKRLAKEAQAKAKADEKEKKKVEQAAKAPAEGKVAKAEDAEELDPTKYRENRMKMVAGLKDPYPHKWDVNMSIPSIIEKYKGMADGTQDDAVEVKIAGRVKSMRASGASLKFYDLYADGCRVQVMAQAQFHDGEDFVDAHANIKRGDIIGVRGCVGKSKRGELSVFPREVKLLATCMHMLPTDYQA